MIMYVIFIEILYLLFLLDTKLLSISCELLCCNNIMIRNMKILFGIDFVILFFFVWMKSIFWKAYVWMWNLFICLLLFGLCYVLMYACRVWVLGWRWWRVRSLPVPVTIPELGTWHSILIIKWYRPFNLKKNST